MELIVEPDMYSPSVDEQGNYVDKVPSFNVVKQGLYCPCGTRKDKTYETSAKFTNHVKTQTHKKWLIYLNLNKANYFYENEMNKKVVHSQKLIISQQEKDISNKILTISYLTELIGEKKTIEVCVENLIDFY